VKIDSLQKIMLAIAQSRSVESVLQQVVAGVAECSNVALVRIWLIGKGDICAVCRFSVECPSRERCLHLAASAGHPRSPGVDISRLDGAFRRFPLGVRKIGQIAKTGQPLLISDVTPEQPWVAESGWIAAEGVQTFAGHPLVFRGEILGVLGVFDRGQFDDEDFAWLRTFADHAAVAIANARAFEEIEALKRRLEQENDYLREEVTAALGSRELLGESAALRKVLHQVDLVAPTDAAVLVQGESGTGKELVARAIHQRSSRGERPLIKVNCGAIPENLFESEFFGHARGAFTGALKDKPGRFELADGGTLFLDEIGELPLAMQAKLLRVLQEQEVERVGETRLRKINVRIVAASNRNLQAEAEAGRFRQDLYYRLSVFPIELPPLRARREDIAPLAAHFVRLAARKMNRPPPRFTKAHAEQLAAHDWPGNVRELQNAVERAVILARGGPLTFELPGANRLEISERRSPAIENPSFITRAAWKQHERESIKMALQQSRGKVFGAGGAAELLGMKPTTLASRLKALGLSKTDGLPLTGQPVTLAQHSNR
jgi:transcriptional regulator with GAF, ATPase, and Fis domain